MKITPLTKKEIKKLEKVLKEICFIDNKMKEVSAITKVRHTIVFHERFRFEFLSKIEQFFKNTATPARTLIGCVTVNLMNCTVRIYRDYKP